MAFDRIEETFLDLAINVPADFNFEMNRRMNWQANLNTDFYGKYPRADLTRETVSFGEVIAFAEFEANWFESEQTPNLDGDLYSGLFGLSFQTAYDIDLGFVYSPGFIDFDSFSGRVSGDGDSHSFGGYALKRYPQQGFKFGVSYLYQTTDITARDRVFAVDGELDSDEHGVSFGGGIARKYGENQPGRNIAFDTTANFLYSTKDISEKNSPLPVNNFDHDAWWFAWRNLVSHNLHQRVAIFGSFTLYHLLDEDDRGRIPTSFGNTTPGRDRTIGEVGGGITAILGRGFAVQAGVRTAVFNQSYDDLITGLSLSYKF